MSVREARFGATQLPEEEADALRRARRLQWLSVAYLLTAVTLVYLVMGRSQAMKAAWFEDLLALIPPIAFLVATRVAAGEPDPAHPYGYHRAVGVGHLVAATALTTMGAILVWDSGSSLLKAEHPGLGLQPLWGTEVWSGWLMIAVLTYTGIPPVLLGKAKMKLAEQLHDRVLYADADMNKADWMTAAGAAVGILGIGVGLWWADAAAALFIAGSILHDGVRNMRHAVNALMDVSARTVDGGAPHPLGERVDAELTAPSWVAEAACRLRDEGHVFHAECFVVPTRWPTWAELDHVRDAVRGLDWKLDDVVIVPVEHLPEGVRPVPRQ